MRQIPQRRGSTSSRVSVLSSNTIGFVQFLDANEIHHVLEQMDGKLFGASLHECKFNPPISESAARQFEEDHNIVLPQEYRHFLIRVGNGGVGPYYGIFPLGMMDGSSSAIEPWHENEGIVGTLSVPFLLTSPWNDLSSQPDPALSKTNPDEYERQLGVYDATYFNAHLLDGAIPICHMGCALRVWLIVTGPQAGFLWRDGRAECTGLSPMKLQNGNPANFSAWYLEWLENPLNA
jgi:hypothetical protein